MMGTILQSGNFISDGTAEAIALRSDVDFMYVYNWDAVFNATNDGTDLNVEFYWQRGMPQGQGLAKKSFGSAPIAGGQPGPLGESQLDVNTGFVLFNQGADAAVTGGVAFSAVSNSTTPVVTTSSIAASGISLQSGDVVRLSQPSGGADVNDLLGIDFQVNYTSDTSFTFANALQQAPGAAGVLPGTWRKVNVSSIFYPETRYIVNITQAAQAVVTTSVDHDYLAGQEVRFHIDTLKDLNKMVEIDNLIGTIVDTTDSTFTVDIDTRAFTPFLFPTIAQAQAIASNYTPAYVGPVGGNTAYSVANNLDSLTDAEVNIAFMGIQLLGGNSMADSDAGPAGAVGDLMYWVAGTSSIVNNEV